MIFNITFTTKKGEPINFYESRYCDAVEHLNNLLFSGYDVIKLETFTAFTSEKNTKQNTIPYLDDIKVIKICKKNTDKKTYNDLMLQCKTKERKIRKRE